MSQTLARSQTYTATRLGDGKPLIDQSSFTDIDPKFSGLGENINGPSLIRVPDWIAPTDRADPAARYYLYFADHSGNFIRMAWSAAVEGPYTLFGLQPSNGGRMGVLEIGKGQTIELANRLEIRGHVASPDVHVNDAQRRIEMYFHGPAANDGKDLNQKTFVAVSSNGLDFNDGIGPVVISPAYARVFNFRGRRYAITSRGAISVAPEYPFTPPDGFDFSKELWEMVSAKVSGNPFQADIDADPKGPERVRHSTVRVKGGTLEVFHSRVGDRPERILLSTIDLAAGEAKDWNPTYPPEVVLEPTLDWEGVGYPLEKSKVGKQVNVRQLRDPFVFEDADGALYLFYTGAGEEGIGAARLTPATSRNKP